MNQYVIVLEYQSKEFMNLTKIMTFCQNLKKIKDKDISVNLVLYGNNSNEELSVCMSYFNRLVKEPVCDFAISIKTKNIIYIKENEEFFEGGANHKTEKISDKYVKDIKNTNFDSIIMNFYNIKKQKIKYWAVKNWESTILDLVEE